MIKHNGVRIALVIAFTGVAIMIVNQWRGSREQPPIDDHAQTPSAATEGAAGARPAAVGASEDQPPPGVSSVPAFANTRADEVPGESSASEPSREALVEGIDPLLRERNIIVRSVGPDQTGPGFEELESRFAAEGDDASWSDGMEARILDEVSQIAGLRLVSIDTECRETVCRVKLFYPAGTNSLASLDQLRPIASRIGLGQPVEVATIGDDGVPVSLLYFGR